MKLALIADPSKTATSTLQSEILIAGQRLMSAVRIARIVAQTANNPFAYRRRPGRSAGGLAKSADPDGS